MILPLEANPGSKDLSKAGADKTNARTATLIMTDQTDVKDTHALCGEDNDNCRPGCGACCIAPSISSPIPGMPQGKPAGVRCEQLDQDNLCRLFGDSRRPDVCYQFTFERTLCGTNRQQALENLAWLEGQTLSTLQR